MSIVMDEEVKRWTARRKSALALEDVHRAVQRQALGIKTPAEAYALAA